ncbi:MAG: hypothetical protein WBB68_01810 [Candidatus Moraniibacteriota bacterium]
MTIESLTTVLNQRANTAAMNEFRMAYPHQNFPNAVIRSIALIYGDQEKYRDTLITCRCCIDRPPQQEIWSNFVVGVRFRHFGRQTTVDLVSYPVGRFRNLSQEHARRLDWLSAPTDAQFGNRALSAPLIVAEGTINTSSDGTLKFSGPGNGRPESLLGVDVSLVANTIASFFDLRTGGATSHEFFHQLNRFLVEYTDNPDFYEQFALWLCEQQIQLTPAQSEALIAMKVHDRAQSEHIDLSTAYLDEIYSGQLARICNTIRAVRGE